MKNLLFSFSFSQRKFFSVDLIKKTISSIKSPSSTPFDPSLVDTIAKEDDTFAIYLKLHKDFRFTKSLINTALLPLNLKFKINIAKEEKPVQTSQTNKIDRIKHIIAVSSAKGGVGKSTVSVNLAYALSSLGHKTGIFDADIYGPSLPTMVSPEKPFLVTYEQDKNTIVPVLYEGVKTMSFGYSDHSKALVRGPIVSGIVTSLVKNTDWGELDFLVVDFPPGTGDIQLSLAQELPFAGAVIVTTPQKLSFIDVVKGIEMFDDLKVPVLAAVENMVNI